MARKIGLGLVFLVALYAGFWAVAAPLAVGIKLIWWNDPISARADVFIGAFCLLGGGIIAFFFTRFVASKWKE